MFYPSIKCSLRAIRNASLHKSEKSILHARPRFINSPSSPDTLQSIGSRKSDPFFVPQLRSYGKEAGVPDELWKPLAEESMDSLPGANAKEKISFVLSRIQDHLKTNP